MRSFKLYIAIAIVISLGACKGKKEVGQSVHKNCSLNIAEVDSLGIYSESIKNSWLKIKGSAKITLQDDAFNVSLQVRAHLDDVVWLSISKAGFPIAKVLLKTDSVFAIDIFHKKYFKTSYKELGEKIGMEINFQIAQNIILGQYIKIDTITNTWQEQRSLAVSNVSKKILTKTQSNSISLDYPAWCQWISCDDKTVTKHYFANPREKQLCMNYTDIDSSLMINIPKNIKILALKSGVRKLESIITYNKFKSTKSLNVPFKIPDGYAKME